MKLMNYVYIMIFDRTRELCLYDDI